MRGRGCEGCESDNGDDLNGEKREKEGEVGGGGWVVNEHQTLVK